ncbi:phosphodiester glycosidase family protein [Pedobacter arcticus]|uniref:phosphodiester glycosidase family protein n=1 Tax=Pedobacter arcticus TaxID=752140 RepID=UPI00031285ED|nr:phosphodiester glycosidase family protein [Pedobacter arcticus]
MKKIFFILFISTLHILTGCAKYEDGTQLPYVVGTVDADKDLKDLIDNTPWVSKNISDGIVWKYYQFPNIFDSRQYINVFDIDLSKNLKFEIPYTSTADLFTASQAGERNNADIAINGSYFGNNYGGSTVYFRHDGTVITQTVANFDSFRENAAFTLSASGKPSIVKKPSGGWDQVNASYVLAGGPLLVYEGKPIGQLNAVFNTTRHPRTVLGTTDDNHLLMVVIDGRSSQSQGLTTVQLTELMMALGCIYAVNMDGGGSSTAWTKDDGVVNHPTDNGKFDHDGQRPLGTAITVTKQ